MTTLKLLLASLALLSCEGSISAPARGGSGGGDSPLSPDPIATACGGAPAVSPGEAPMQRLSPVEYDNSVRDVLRLPSLPPAVLPDAPAVTEAVAEKYLEAAERVSAIAVQNLGALLRCEPQTAGDAACASDFIAGFGRRAFRRPLEAIEQQRLESLYATSRATWDFSTAIALVIQAVLQSPQFLYRVEIGEAASGATVARLTSHELAARLSYLLWNTTPDDALSRAADEGDLATAEQLEAQARRLLQDARARPTVAAFHAWWLGLDGLASVNKDPAVFPAFSAGLKPLLRRETELFAEYVFWDTDGAPARLLDSPVTFVDSQLATFYGLPFTGSAFGTVAGQGRRVGLLTQGSFLALHAKPDETSPVQRGKFVREQLLCNTLQSPPPDVNVQLPAFDPNRTMREKLAAHRANPACAGCHQLMDPVGLGLEDYDGVGIWRTTESGRSVDASGEIFSADVAGTFTGGVELSKRLASSGQYRGCVTKQWFRYAFGRADTGSDACSLAKLTQRLEQGGMRELVVALTSSDAFVFRVPYEVSP